jgi:hypothetical protein
MPKLLVFAPCEKAITDTVGLVSLISIVEKLDVNVPKEVELPPRVAVPLRWDVFSLWSLDRNEVGLFEQIIEMVASDGRVAMHAEPKALESTIPGATGAKIVSTVTSIPVTEGRLELRLSYRKIGDPQWILAASYPVEVTLVRQ